MFARLTIVQVKVDKQDEATKIVQESIYLNSSCFSGKPSLPIQDHLQN